MQIEDRMLNGSDMVLSCAKSFKFIDQIVSLLLYRRAIDQLDVG